MTIDGRELSSQDIMRALQGAIRKKCDTEPVEVIVSDQAEAARVKAFMKMSGLQVQTLREAGRWTVQGSGSGCHCC